MEQVQLPPHVYDRCLAFMHEMNLLHGSFDIIQTPENEYVFLEMNEMGQFLWLEERLPEIPALDMFVSFALNPGNTFEYAQHRRSSAATFGNYLSTSSYRSFQERLAQRKDAITGGHYKVDYVE
jgi:hypothetical protein